MEMDSYEGQPVDPKTNRANIVLKRKTFGGIPPGAGMRDDVIELFQELEEARMCLVQIEKLIGITPEPNIILGEYLGNLLLVKWAKSWENRFMPYANNEGADQPAHPRSLISTFVVHCLDNIIPLFAIAEMSRL